MSEKVYNVLFLCKRNSARSIMAEAILNRLGQGRFKAFSAGSDPAPKVNEYTIDLLKNMNYATDYLVPKAMSDIHERMDFIFTVCDTASAHDCPAYSEMTMGASWAIDDPVSVEGNEAEQRVAFNEAFRMLNNRIDIFVNLPLQDGDRARLQSQLDHIGD